MSVPADILLRGRD